MLYNEWKLPLNVAIAIHVSIILAALYLPEMFKAKPKFADIYTVSIINIAEPAPEPVVQSQQATPPPVIKPPAKNKKIAPIAEAVEKPAPAPKKAVSLKPLKRKKIQKVTPAKSPDRNLEKARLNRQRLAQALRDEELAAERAKLAREALEAERKLLQNDTPIPKRQNSASENSVSSSSRPTNSSRTAGSTNLIESQYLASIFNRLHQYWAPPEYLQQDPNLTSVVVITINPDGQVANMLFENKSGNRVFDQFVIKTIESAAPMPPIPPALKKKRFEIGLRFKPGSIQ